MNPQSHRLSRDEVVRSERRAWADVGRDGDHVSFNDGVDFWCRDGRSDAQPAVPWRTPRTGRRLAKTAAAKGAHHDYTDTGTLNPWGPVSQANRVRSYQSGRVCAHSECGTILSIYNPAKYCTVHAAAAAGGRRRTPRPIREVACEQCGTVFETGNQARKYCSDRCRRRPSRGASEPRPARRSGCRRRSPSRRQPRLPTHANASGVPPDSAAGGSVLASAIVAIVFTVGFIVFAAALRRRIRRY